MSPRDLNGIKARVAVLRDAMSAARLDYFRELLSLRTLQGDAEACERIQRQIKNLVNTQRPRVGRASKKGQK